MRTLDQWTRALGVAITLSGSAAAQTVIRVDDDAPDGGDGATWQTAFNDLQDAIAAIDAIGNPGVYEIRIAGGTYRPDRGTGDRFESFEIDDDVLQSAVTLRLEGGFAGLARLAAPDTQDPARYRSVLDGDLNGDDLPGLVNREDNSRRVLRARADQPFSVHVDGVVVRGASGPSAARIDGFLRISRCTFEDNSVSGLDASKFQSIINCPFRFNTAGAGLSVQRHTDVVGCAFIGNEIGFSSTSERGVWLANCLVYGNTDQGITDSSFADVFNCILWANGDGSFDSPSGHTFPGYSIIQGYKGDFGGSTGDDPLFLDELGPDGIPMTGDEDLRVRYQSPARDGALPGVLPQDLTDLDGDGDRAEPLPVDLAGIARDLNRSLDMGPHEICPADFTGASDPAHPSYGIPDGDADADDWFVFLDFFASGDPSADLSASDDPDNPGYGVPDGLVTIDDYFFFLDAVARGCDPR